MSDVHREGAPMLFSQQEYAQRLARARTFMADEELDHLLVLEPENVTYLTGFFTAGYPMSFQFAVIADSGDPVVVTRIVERYWAERSSAYPDSTAYWSDGETPESVAVRVLRDVGVSGRVGVELGSWRANARLITAISEATEGITVVDVGNGPSRLRFVKSPAELDLMRQAGEISGQVMEAAIAAARPGARERDLAAAMADTAIRAGSDMTFPGAISSGRAAKEIHAPYTDRRLEPDDLIFAEAMGNVHNYHARFMRPIVVGRPPSQLLDLAAQLLHVQDEALASVKAGVSCAIADRIYRQGIAATGAADGYPNKTFYGVGLLLDPNTLEPQQVDPSTDFSFEAGTTWHTYVTVAGVNFSETIVVTEDGFERLTTFRRELVLV